MTLNNKKIKRELTRISQQITSWIMNVYEPYKRWQHKRSPHRNLNSTINHAHISTGKIAVYLVFQPQGLAPSTWLTLEHLQSKGYSTMLVSNCPLSNDDSVRAMPLCWQIMVRPNFGYDFGGYQDGVLTAMNSGLSIHQMLILNDSIWFPLRCDCDLLDRMEARQAEFVGAFQLEPTRDERKMWGKRRPFMGSFFWHFKHPLIHSSAFKKFWQNYRATSSKYATIHRGEKRFTHYLLDAGFKVDAIFSRMQFDHWLQQAHGEDVYKALEELCTSDPYLSARRLTLLDQYKPLPTWESAAKELALAMTESVNIMATAPLYMVRDLGLPFLKKASDETNLLALKKLDTYFYEHPKFIEVSVWNEIQQALQRTPKA